VRKALTSILSLGERKTMQFTGRMERLSNLGPSSLRERAANVQSPLPPGEGQGEGKMVSP